MTGVDVPDGAPLGVGVAAADGVADVGVADVGLVADADPPGDASGPGETVLEAPADDAALGDGALLTAAVGDGDAAGVPVVPMVGVAAASVPNATAATSPTIAPAR